MRGIALAIIGATLVWAHVQIDKEVGFQKEGANGATVILVVWFLATLFVIAMGW